MCVARSTCSGDENLLSGNGRDGRVETRACGAEDSAETQLTMTQAVEIGRRRNSGLVPPKGDREMLGEHGACRR